MKAGTAGAGADGNAPFDAELPVFLEQQQVQGQRQQQQQRQRLGASSSSSTTTTITTLCYICVAWAVSAL